MKIGLIVAVEMNAIDRMYGQALETYNFYEQKVLKYERHNNEVYVINCGVGPIAAASSTQLLICEFKPDIIMNFGVVGALSEEASSEKIFIVESVVDYVFDTSEADFIEVGRHLEYPTLQIPLSENLIEKTKELFSELNTAVCASGTKFVASKVEKLKINKEFSADIIDMEASAIVITCDRNNVDCLMLKMVADSLNGGAEEFYSEFEKSSDECLRMLDGVIEKL